MRIAVNTRMLIPSRMEGIARYIYETTKRMVLAHPEDNFHFFFDRPFSRELIFADNVTPHVIFPQARHPLLWKWWFDFSVPKILSKQNIDVFYSGDGFLSLRTDVPTLLISHDIYFWHYPQHYKCSHEWYYRYYSPKFHRRADHIIAVSEFTKKDIIRSFGIDNQKISVAGNDASSGFVPLDDGDKKKGKDKYAEGKEYFLYVGSLHPRKNLIGLIKAFEIFRKKYSFEYKLIIFGRKAFKADDIYNNWSRSEFKKDILFIYNQEADLKKLMAASLALCYVSLWEGFGIPILEAFHAGVPVITSDISSMPEVAGNAAMLVDPFDPVSIATAMGKIAEDAYLRKELVINGHKRKEQFSWEKSAGIIYKKLEEISH